MGYEEDILYSKGKLQKVGIQPTDISGIYDRIYILFSFVGCGGGSVAADEVKLGAYTVKLYSANTHAEVQGTGGSSYKITAKADITFDKLMRDLIKYEYIEINSFKTFLITSV